MLQKELNQLLSDFYVMYHKLQNYHWYIKGYHFYDDHEQLEKYYDEMAENADVVAELMMQIEVHPEATMKGWLALTRIEEPTNEEISSEDAYTHVLKDYKYLLEEIISVKRAAEKVECDVVANTMDDFINQFSKNIWMLRQVVKQ